MKLGVNVMNDPDVTVDVPIGGYSDSEMDKVEDADASSEEVLGENELTGIFEAEKEPLTIRQFLTQLEDFLDETLENDSRGNVFLSENGNGVSMNIVIGTSFASNNDDGEINQVNVIISPTDRTLLGSEGVSMDDRDYEDNETWLEDDEDNEYSAFDRARDSL